MFTDEYRENLISIIEEVQADISDEYRAYDGEEEAGVLLTIATDDAGEAFAFQTGDNCFSGACYRYPHWASCGVYRDTSPSDLADDLLAELWGFLPEMPYSVLLLYPDYLASDYGRDTFHAHVEAVNPHHAVAVARDTVGRTAVDCDPEDFAVLLVLRGHHYDLSPEG